MGTAGDFLDQARAAERRGDHLATYDIARRGLNSYPDDIALRHRAVLALARTGATRAARLKFLELGMDRVDTEDVAALAARLSKDEALAATGAARVLLARRAALEYEAVYRRTLGHYPAINAATLFQLAGEPAQARVLALAALDASQHADTNPGSEDAYWRCATKAEAQLILGDFGTTVRLLELAARTAAGDFAAMASTRRQLSLLCVSTGAPLSLLDPLKAPPVIHYTGHMIAAPGREGTLRDVDEAPVAAAIAASLARRAAGQGFGSLACGSDILFAEALLARNADLHAVLPFEASRFVESSVLRGGERWAPRFERCLRQARSVTVLTPEPIGDADILYRAAADHAMGLAILRARALETDTIQLAVWNGQVPTGMAGTARDVERWRWRQLPTEVISPNGHVAVNAGSTTTLDPNGMLMRAMLFGDVKGFSKLTEPQVDAFTSVVLGGFGEVLGSLGDAVEYRNTWGDGIFAVLTDVNSAARCALSLQEFLLRADLEAAGLAGLSLRLGGHYGPVVRRYDGIRQSPGFFGTHVTRTARIEPVTPEGETYVTEAFAAALALEGCPYRCEYVGEIPAAKGFGVLRMHSLHRAAFKL